MIEWVVGWMLNSAKWSPVFTKIESGEYFNITHFRLILSYLLETFFLS